ncbi:MAB_1171c family putative transporter [Streptomyces lavendulocolor]|uniref:MAB_1171c family putative transporter n=1 Tax=Streptomyces lavendulocolor TaxID=67316 RepID=UPI003C2BDECF
MRLFDIFAVPPLWLFVFWKLPGIRAAPRQDRLMWRMWAIWAVAFTIGIPAIRRVIDATVGLESFTNLPVHMLSLCAMAMLFEFIREATGARHHGMARLRWAVLGLTEAGLTVTFALTPLPDGEADLVTAVDSPSMTAYWMIFLGYVAYGVVSAIRLCWRYGRHAAPGPTRTSMRLLGWASCLGLVYVVHRLVHLVAKAAGWPGPSADGVVATTQALLAGTLLLLVASVCWPSLAEVRRRARLRGQVKAIRPFWRLLTEATPEVVLPLPEELRQDEELVRYRYVIEIRDSAIALSGHVGEAEQEAARRAAADAGAPGQEETAEAAVLLFAAACERTGLPPRFPEHALVQESADLDTEAEWLRRVALAAAAPAAARIAEGLGAAVEAAAGPRTAG